MGTAAGQGTGEEVHAGSQNSQQQDRSSEAVDDVGRQFVFPETSGIDDQTAVFPVGFDVQRSQQPNQVVHIDDPRDIAQGHGFAREEGSGNQGQCRILVALDRVDALERVATVDNQTLIHDLFTSPGQCGSRAGAGFRSSRSPAGHISRPATRRPWRWPGRCS